MQFIAAHNVLFVLLLICVECKQMWQIEREMTSQQQQQQQPG
jgi:hypothetical protein